MEGQTSQIIAGLVREYGLYALIGMGIGAALLVFTIGMQSRREQMRRASQAHDAARAALEATGSFIYGEPLEDEELSRRLGDMMQAPPKKSDPPPSPQPSE